MGILVNPKMSGFRKSAEIHEPTKIDEIRIRANESDVVAAADVRENKNTSDSPPHRPWLVPGAGKL